MLSLLLIKCTCSVSYWVQNIGILLILFQLGSGPEYFALSTALQYVPYVSFGLLTNALANRWKKFGLLRVSYFILTAASLLCAFATIVTTSVVQITVAFSALVGIVNAVVRPARQALAIERLSDSQTARMIAWSSATNYGVRIVVPIFLGWLLSTFGILSLFFAFVTVNAGVLLVLAWARGVVDGKGILPPETLYASVMTAATRETASLSLVLLFMALLPLSLGTIVPLLFTTTLQAEASDVGFALGAMSAGSIVGSLLSGGSATRRASSVVAAPTMLGICLILLTTVQNNYGIYVVTFGAGFCVSTFLTSTNYLMLSSVVRESRGRVSGLYDYIVAGIGPLGSALVAVSIGTIGFSQTVVFLAACSFVGAAAVLGIVLRGGSRKSEPQARQD